MFRGHHAWGSSCDAIIIQDAYQTFARFILASQIKILKTNKWSLTFTPFGDQLAIDVKNHFDVIIIRNSRTHYPSDSVLLPEVDHGCRVLWFTDQTKYVVFTLPAKRVMKAWRYNGLVCWLFLYLADCASKAIVSTADTSEESNENASSDSNKVDSADLSFPATAGSSWSTSLGNSSSSLSGSCFVKVGALHRGDEVAEGFAAAASDGSTGPVFHD